MSEKDLSSYAKKRFENEINDNDIANEIKKAFFSYCNMVMPEEFKKYEDKLGYCYIFVRNMAEFLHKHKISVPVFSVEPEDLDDGIDNDVVDAMCEDIEEFSINWTDDDNLDENAKAIPLLKRAFPDAPLITNILGIAVGLEDDGDDSISKEEEVSDSYKKEVEQLNKKLREDRIKQAVIMQAYIKEIKKQNFPIDEKLLILNYFKEYAKNPKLAYDNLISSPAYFSPIQVHKLLEKGIKEKDIPNMAQKIHKEISDFLKTLKI